MMTQYESKHTMLSINRWSIYIMGLFGIVLDSTLACVISLTLWVWLPNCVRVEWVIVKEWKRWWRRCFRYISTHW